MFKPKIPAPEKVMDLLRKADALEAYPDYRRYFTELHDAALGLARKYGKRSAFFGKGHTLEHNDGDLSLRIHFDPDHKGYDRLEIETRIKEDRLKMILKRHAPFPVPLSDQTGLRKMLAWFLEEEHEEVADRIGRPKHVWISRNRHVKEFSYE